MKRLLAFALTLALCACGGSAGPEGPQGQQGPAGPQGPQGLNGADGGTGPAGGGYYTSRNTVYCNTVAMAAGDTFVIASCNNLQDLPLSGGCSLPYGTLPVTNSIPVYWDSAAAGSSAAGWLCSWTGTNAAQYGASATICCVSVPNQ